MGGLVRVKKKEVFFFFFYFLFFYYFFKTKKESIFSLLVITAISSDLVCDMVPKDEPDSVRVENDKVTYRTNKIHYKILFFDDALKRCHQKLKRRHCK